MGTIDPALGFDVDFEGGEVRDALHFAMQVGTPPDSALRPTFVFASTGKTYRKDGVTLPAADVATDRDGKPLDPDVEVVTTPGQRVQVDCAIEIQRADAEEVPVGSYRPSKAVVTLLDVDHAKVKGCRELIYNGDRYGAPYEPEVFGLFDVGIFTVIFFALDDS